MSETSNSTQGFDLGPRYQFLTLSTSLLSILSIVIVNLCFGLKVIEPNWTTIPNWIKYIIQPLHLKINIILVFFALATFILSSVGSSYKDSKLRSLSSIKVSEKVSIALLFISTFAFMLLIIAPIGLMGGGRNSIFSVWLVTLASLTVIIADKKRTKIIFMITTLTLFGFLSFFYIPIYIYKKSLYSLFFILMNVIAILIIVWLTYERGSIFKSK